MIRTKEEAIKELKEDIELYTPLHGTIDDVDRDLPDGRLITALEMGIKALEQEPKLEPCWETCFECPLSHGCPKIKGCTNEQAMEYASKIPNDCPLSAQPKTGHWIEHPEIGTSTPEYLMFYECSECGDKQCFCKLDIHKKHFCNNCGARMVEPQETETWNGYHGQITAPKGTFERIFNDADDDNDI